MARRVTRRRLPSRAQLAVGALGILTVCSLIAATVGTFVVDSLTDDNDDLSVDAPEENPLIVSLRETAEANPSTPQALIALADYLANTGDLDGAIDWYEQALALDPNDWRTRLAFARDLSDGEKRADAEVQFQRVVALAPDDAEAHFYLAELYSTWQPPRAAEAAAEYQRVIAVQPSSFYAEQAAQRLVALGQPPASPVAGTPVMEATP